MDYELKVAKYLLSERGTENTKMTQIYFVENICFSIRVNLILSN